MLSLRQEKNYQPKSKLGQNIEKARYRRILLFFITNHLIKNNTIMGRGDIKTKKGKTFAGSFGKSRPAKPVAAKKAVEKKAEADKKA